MTIEDRSLELSPDALRGLIHAATERIVAHIASLPDQPSADTEGGAALARSLVEPLPQSGLPAEQLLDLLFDRVVPKSFNTAGPGYLAYIPGGGLPHAAVADLVADAVNRYVGVFAAAPGLAQIESNVVRWFADLAGLPPAAGGILTSGGSLATFSALVAARRDRLPENFFSGILYASDQTHHALQKAAMLAGFPADNVREIPTDETYRMRVPALEEAIAADRAAGLTPFFVAGNAGTTNTGAVDDLAALGELCARERLWFHVDGAYGGFFLLTEQGRRRMAGIERADSVVLDPHKGLFLPYGTGALLVRDVETLRRAHALSAEYLPSMQEDPDLVDFNMLSPELSRDFRGLRVWLPLKMHGIGVFRTNLEEKLALALHAAKELARMPDIEILAPPQLSILAFRLAPPGRDGAALDALNRELLDRINGGKRVYLTGTTLRGRFAIRICVLSFRTHRDRMDQGLDDIRSAIEMIGGKTMTPAPIKPAIAFAALDALDIRVGTIERVEEVPKSDKLLRLTVRFGDHTRKILSGMKQERPRPEELVGVQALFVVNLEPRKMMGEVSEGMLFDLGSADGILPALAVPERPVPDGTRAG